MKFILHIFLLLLSAHTLFAQKQGNIWYFGNKAGLDFNSGKPVVLTNSEMLAPEGSASICDSYGKLLFYTDGINVWNRNHKVMDNGSGLFGHPSSTQAGVIVPFPADTSKYYVFTVDYGGQPNGFRYSVVDITLDNGNGSVTNKNELLVTPVAEKVTAVRHKNGRDIWVIVHQWNSRDFLSFLVTPTGISAPVTSTAGVFHGYAELNAIGNLKASPDGKRIAYVSYIQNTDCQVFDFDNVSGKISNPVTLHDIGYAYGLEFSPSGNLLYTGSTSEKKVYQYNLEAGDSNAINNSRIVLYEPGQYYHTFGSFQLAPDGKIYIVCDRTTNLSIIHKPDELGAGCDFEVQGIDLQRSATLGLPTFIQSFFNLETYFTFTEACSGEPTALQGFCSGIVEKWQWNFGDPASGISNTSDKRNPVHVFSAAGNYKVTLIVTTKSGIDTVVNEVKVFGNTNLDLGADIVTCDPAPIKLNAGGSAEKYLWSTGDSTDAITITKSGKYWVQTKSGHCSGSDTINISYITQNNIDLGNDTAICFGTEILLKSNINNAEYLWSTGSKDSSITVKESGKYWLRIKASDCEITDSIEIRILPPPEIYLGPDEVLCEGDSILLDAKNEGAHYKWSTGENTQKIKLKNHGIYWVLVEAGNCKATDTIVINACPSHIYVPNAFSPNSDGVNDYFRVYASDIYKANLSVYNRWGECIFETDDIWKGWDGNYRNTTCPVDEYIWILKYKENIAPARDYQLLKGSVLLLK